MSVNVMYVCIFSVCVYVCRYMYMYLCAYYMCLMCVHAFKRGRSLILLYTLYIQYT